jgi:hypothetical protein
VFGAAALLMVATACTPSSPSGRSSSEVRVGDCFQLATWAALTGPTDASPAVSCTGPHDAEAFRTFTYTGRYTARRTRPLPEQLQGELTSACSGYDAIRGYLGAGPVDAQWGVGAFVRVPTRREWAAGDRTIRCDLVPDNAGSGGPVVSAPLRGVLRLARSERFRLCYRAGRSLTCDRPHDAEAVAGAPALDAGPMPEPATLARAATAICASAISSYLGHPLSADLTARPLLPTKQRWDRGDRHVDCAVGPVDPRQLVTGTLRGGLA